MSDTEQIYAQYLRLYDGLLRKDRTTLEDVLDETFVQVHTSGLEQTKEEYIASVLSGEIDYRAVRHESMPVEIRGDVGVLVGRSQVTGSLFSGRRETRGVQQTLTLVKTGEGWKIIRVIASAY